MQTCTNCGRENNDEAFVCANCGTPFTEEVGGNRCDFCAKKVPYSEYFSCKYCGKKLCYDHRLPENHLCKSTNMRRVVPGEYSNAGSSYSYSSSPYQSSARATFSISFTKQGRNLVALILSGIVIGLISTFFAVNQIPVLYYLIQENVFVFRGWVVPLVTSIIVAPPNLSGLEDVVFNAIALFFVDRLLSFAYTRRQYYTVFLAAGVFGNVLTLLQGPFYGSFGASGGIFGLLAGAVTFNYAVSKKVNYSLVMWFLIWFFLSSISPDVNWIAHLGGSLFGLVAGYYIGMRKTRHPSRVGMP